ncbi:MAG: polysaccharide biosynthesis protein [Clostridiales bacterium]|nr:polysaccharide biosynthesis protein [Clostridiales bacterium]
MNNKKVKSSTGLFFSGVIILTISNLIIKAIGALFKIPMTHIIGELGMGYYSSAYVVYTVFYMISTAGLPVAVSLLIAENRSKGRVRQVKKVFKISLILFLIIGSLGAAIMIFGAPAFADAIKSPNSRYSIMALAPTLFFICVASAYRGYFQGYQFMMPVAVSQLIEALCKLFLGIALAYYAIGLYGKADGSIHFAAAYAIFAVTIGAGLGMLFLTLSKLLFKSRKYDAEFTDISGENRYTDSTSSILKSLALIALPITISSSVMSLTNLIDTATMQGLLQKFCGMSQIEATAAYGNYTSLCVPMFNLPPYLIYPISYSIVPLIKSAITVGDKKRAGVVMESSLKVSALIGLPCGLGMAALAEPILQLFHYPAESIQSAAPLLTLLAPSAFFLCVITVTNAMLQANGHTYMPIISMVAGAVIKIVTNRFILIRTIGLAGTPVSTFLCYLTATALNIFFLVKYVGIRPNMGKVFFRPLIAAAVCSAAAIGVSMLTREAFGVSASTLAAILAAALVYTVLIFALRAVTEDDIILLPKGEKIRDLLKKIKLFK